MADTLDEEDGRPHIEPELYEGLGRIVVVWSCIEALLAEFLSYLIPADPGGMYVLNQSVSTDMKLKWIRSLSEIRIEDPELLTQIEEILTRLDDARQQRNAYVHGVWGTKCPAGSVIIQSVNLNRSEVIREELATAADFDDLVVHLVNLQQALLALGRGLGLGWSV